MSRVIHLTQGKSTLVDDEDYALFSSYRWQYDPSNGGYARRTVRANGGFKTVYLSRAVMAIGEEVDVDHKNGDGLDNRKDNLRVCSHKQNTQNRQPNKKGASMFKGVQRNKNRWKAVIGSGSNRCYLGTFGTEEAAATAYNVAALARYGEFACPNKAIVFEDNAPA